jgi:UPF0042 nucleotide-binding protein
VTDTEFLIVSGYSGSGKTTALRALEDLGFYAVDNLPVGLLRTFADHILDVDSPISRAAIVMDIRGKETVPQYPEAIRSLRDARIKIKLIFLDASLDTLQKRFSETRRAHPLTPSLPLSEALAHERVILEPIRQAADIHLDTTDLSPHDLRRIMRDRFGAAKDRDKMLLSFVSFGFKSGLPKEADLVIDVRFLANPFFTDELRSKDGRDPEVREFVDRAPGAEEFMEHLRSFIEYMLPRYLDEGRGYLTIAIGCTGGRHRSVAIAERMSQYFKDRGPVWVQVRHRDLPEG